jgi:hypothetical protein
VRVGLSFGGLSARAVRPDQDDDLRARFLAAPVNLRLAEIAASTAV